MVALHYYKICIPEGAAGWALNCLREKNNHVLFDYFHVERVISKEGRISNHVFHNIYFRAHSSMENLKKKGKKTWPGLDCVRENPYSPKKDVNWNHKFPRNRETLKLLRTRTDAKSKFTKPLRDPLGSPHKKKGAKNRISVSIQQNTRDTNSTCKNNAQNYGNFPISHWLDWGQTKGMTKAFCHAFQVTSWVTPRKGNCPWSVRRQLPGSISGQLITYTTYHVHKVLTYDQAFFFSAEREKKDAWSLVNKLFPITFGGSIILDLLKIFVSVQQKISECAFAQASIGLFSRFVCVNKPTIVDHNRKLNALLPQGIIKSKSSRRHVFVIRYVWNPAPVMQGQRAFGTIWKVQVTQK